ncbi:MAG: biopolymer transporter ExbD [Campylobacterota bacterium]|nr:biopolymer transporter ExbD [Campylobacterota bacterium]
MRFRKREEKLQDVDMSPLIDMVFILLIFFMVSTTFVKDMKLELDRPSASSASKASSKVIRVYIDKFGDIYVDQQPVKVWAIQGKMRDLLRMSTNKSILVVTDADVQAQRLIDVIDQCRSAGAKDVAVATNKEV